MDDELGEPESLLGCGVALVAMRGRRCVVELFESYYQTDELARLDDAAASKCSISLRYTRVRKYFPKFVLMVR